MAVVCLLWLAGWLAGVGLTTCLKAAAAAAGAVVVVVVVVSCCLLLLSSWNGIPRRCVSAVVVAS